MELFDSNSKKVQKANRQLNRELKKETGSVESGKTFPADDAGEKLARELSKGEASALEHGWIPFEDVLKELSFLE